MSMKSINKILKKILPTKFISILHRIYFFTRSLILQLYYPWIQWKYNYILKKVQKKDTITVAFFLIHDSVWKYDCVYNLLKADPRFEPIVVVCPYVVYGEEVMLHDMNKAYTVFLDKGYNVIKTYNETTKQWLDIKKEIKPDIVFFTNPHPLTKKEYYIYNYLNCLTCYVQYSFHVTHLNKEQYNQAFHNLLWQAFYETPLHKELAQKHALNKGINVCITGYPGIDVLMDKNYNPKDCWKIKDRKIKRIIWSPHHTIEGENSLLDYSNFLQYFNLMKEIAVRFSDEIQIAFKPHPLLKNKLSLNSDWGTEKTNNYYEYWQNLSNGQLNESDYIDLFLTSDAIINDCASFMTEYLYVHKPMLFTARNDKIVNRFNEFGKMSYNCHYHAYDKNGIIDFIENVIKNIDPMKEEREAFFEKYLIPPNDSSASQNIVKVIKNFLK